MRTLEKKHPLAIRWFHWINFPVLVLMMWSGLLIYWANAVYRIALGGYEWARWEHFWLAVGYVLFFVVHVVQVARAGWNNFRAMVTGYEIATVAFSSSLEQPKSSTPAAGTTS